MRLKTYAIRPIHQDALKMIRDWTLRETLFVKEYAGTVPLFQLARDLKRDPRDVASECGRLGVPIVYMGTPLFWCDHCSTWRTSLNRSGLCGVCDKRRRIQVIEGRISSLLALLPVDVREIYAMTETWREGRKREAPPCAPITEGLAPLEAVMARTAYLAEYDRWQNAQEHRRVRAVQKRKERIAKKVRELQEAA